MIFFINEKVINETIDYKSFRIKDSLNPIIFNHNSKMIKEVREALLKMAENYFEFLSFDWIDEKYVDVWLVGSMASYNWSEAYSDIDVHLIIDYKKISDNIDLLENDLWALKSLYNKEHNLEIKGFNVEMYLQDINEDIKSNGIFSILKQTWIKKPEKLDEVTFNKRKVSHYVSDIEKKAEEAIKQFRLGKYELARTLNANVHDDLMELRKNGLETGGEFSDKNIAFKALRRNGTIGKLDRLDILSFDKEVSITKTNKEKYDDNPNEIKKPSNDDENGNQIKSNSEEEKDDSKDSYNDGIGYKINGRIFDSLRNAEKVLGIPKSTLEYRINSDSNKWTSYIKNISNSDDM